MADTSSRARGEALGPAELGAAPLRRGAELVVAMASDNPPPQARR